MEMKDKIQDKEVHTVDATRWQEYVEWTKETDKYPITCKPFIYIIGLAEEINEYFYAANSPEGDASQANSELGDIAWYMARLCDWYKFNPFNGSSVDESINLLLLQKMALSAVKKYFREDFGDDEQRVKTLLIVKNLAHQFNANHSIDGQWFYDVIDHNKSKLLKRVSKGTIKGEGDER